jgi:hypothetical protein
MTTQPKEVGSTFASEEEKSSLAAKSRSFVCLKCGADHSHLLSSANGGVSDVPSRWSSLDDLKVSKEPRTEKTVARRKKSRRNVVKSFRSSLRKHLSRGRALALASMLVAALVMALK